MRSTLAIDHLSHTQAGDLMIMDRNYPSYPMLAEICQFKRDFVVRCSSASFAMARLMLKGQGPDSQVVIVRVTALQSLRWSFLIPFNLSYVVLKS